MRKIFVGALVFLAVGICMGQTESPTQPARDSDAMQQNSETKQLFVPSTPKIDFEATLQQMLNEGRLKPGKHIAFRDDPQPDAFAFHFLPGACFTMRTYLFSRDGDGAPPRLKGVSTCVPSNSVQLREARPDGKVLSPQ